MQLVGKLIIKSKNKIIEFLNEESTGRIASIDNIKRDSKVGFEVDKNLEFLPSYFSDPDDASLADTFYISVVIKGNAKIVEDKDEKVHALNGLMKKYQPEGGYLPMTSDMEVLEHTAVIKVIPKEMNGKYKIGQNMSKKDKIDIANKILEKNSSTARETLEIMGFGIEEGKAVLKTDEVW
jgi:nitroimidazol reductase NimA-like FMN-containing flavoprotein (pyridoxamine 5'-phosphate oxidase superfamily)